MEHELKELLYNSETIESENRRTYLVAILQKFEYMIQKMDKICAKRLSNGTQQLPKITE